MYNCGCSNDYEYNCDCDYQRLLSSIVHINPLTYLLTYSLTHSHYVHTAYNFGRYCTHSHRGGNMEGSYVKANSIHHSFQRAVTTHDTRNWEVRDNVAYDIQGHAYFVEDGTEQYNTFSGT